MLNEKVDRYGSSARVYIQCTCISLQNPGEFIVNAINRLLWLRALRKKDFNLHVLTDKVCLFSKLSLAEPWT